MAKPALILVGADKGGVGKTTVARTLLDYFTAHHVPTRAFDSETPKGTLKRFHGEAAEIVDATLVSDQMRIIDTLSTTDSTVTVVDVRAGLLSPTLRALRDIGFLDDDGYLTITDRVSDMVLWGGVNIAPREIEEVLFEHPAVVDCAVLGIPDEQDGEHLLALVQLREVVSETELADHVGSRLAKYKIPHQWEVVEELPRDHNGKVRKRQLRQAYSVIGR